MPKLQEETFNFETNTEATNLANERKCLTIFSTKPRATKKLEERTRQRRKSEKNETVLQESKCLFIIFCGIFWILQQKKTKKKKMRK